MGSELSVKDARYLITGAAGFIGCFLTKKLLEQGCQVIGVDNLNDYYDLELKYARLQLLQKFEGFIFEKVDISDKELVLKLFDQYKPTIVIHLAAQAGVRYSLINPDAYMQSNVLGFFHIIEACKFQSIKHLLYASSSSVYGANRKVPFEETDVVDHPVSLYAATKKTNELMAYTYSHLYQIPTTGLRFFTVYGPFGRPDMAYFGFTRNYFNGEQVHIYNNGDLDHDIYRDFTYIDDIVEGIIKLIPIPPTGNTPYRLLNIGNSRPEKLMTFVDTLEKALSKSLGRKVEFLKAFEPMKAGDVPATYAATDLLEEVTGFAPRIRLNEGLQRFTDWYVDFYQQK